MPDATAEIEARIATFRERVDRLRAEVHKVLVGQDDTLELVLIAMMAGGHALLEGVPGLGKTLLVRTLARALDLEFARIQFTPDLMPADITGTNVVVEDERGQRSFRFQRGPVFTSILLADEINRATPKTQSALLEAMQEGTVTAGGAMHELPQPFFVLATQNPIEMEGTYPLPEAQLDRFLFKLVVPFPDRATLLEILGQTTGDGEAEVRPVLDGAAILELRRLARQVLVARPVAEAAADLVLATHPEAPGATDSVKRFVRYGASPRGGQAILLAAKVRALLQGRYNVAFEDLRVVAGPALRHRIILGFEGEAEGVTTDDVVAGLVARMKD
ncbi:MAG: MoxR family ATPase [Planctomycetota bacterium]